VGIALNPSPTGDFTMSDDIRAKVQEQFGSNASNYVNSIVHNKADELNRFLEIANVNSEMTVLDVGTGGGHTALTFAPHVKTVYATDLTPKMLAAAQAYIEPQADNVVFEAVDAVNIPYDDATFDVVTCRVAAHHFPDIFAFMQGAARVLKPGGILIVQDHYAPEDERDAKYIDAFERLRDPSHVFVPSLAQWRGNFLDVGLEIVAEELTYTEASFVGWVERMSCTPDVVERLEIMLIQAPDVVKDYYQPKAVGTPDATLYHRYMIMAGRKPEA
jgi:ubiquinone/menaquinone biosynthesis C-methylase UbiE